LEAGDLFGTLFREIGLLQWIGLEVIQRGREHLSLRSSEQDIAAKKEAAPLSTLDHVTSDA
jgi:hypothetical protein